ncbi:MAG: exodeoxyribonuclease V subunit gamma [Nitrospirae bacterium]|nr:exodeoxyribonuclease V subunit gamma [Nitrospirota bacterium]
MLNIYLGNIHPDLEDALFRHLSDIKSQDKLSQIAIVAPSGQVRKRLRTLLVSEHEMYLMGVDYLTFHSLSLKLYEEKYGLTSHMICDDFFFTEMIRHILETGNSEPNLFSNFAGTPEGCMAIWRTIRELREARVEPGIVEDGIRDGLFEDDDSEKLVSLMTIYKEFLRIKTASDIIDYSDLPVMASDVAPSSKYLNKFKEIIYYGFYDLTQVQIDLLKSIVRQYPVTMFFPYAEGAPAASFSTRFYDTFIQGLITDKSNVIRLPGPSVHADSKVLFPVKSSTAVIGASGRDDEVSVVAKTILRLVEADGIPFAGIGVVARDINDYIHIIKRVFHAHNIPFVSTGSESADRYPVVKAVRILISIHENGYRRSDIIDLVSAHCCKERLKAFCPEGTELRPDNLDLFTRLSGISKGEKEWERLDKYIEEGFIIRSPGDDDGEGINLVSSNEVAGLKAVIRSLCNDFTSLPSKSSWSEYIERFAVLINRYIDVDEVPPRNPDNVDFDADNYNPAEAVMESMISLRRLEKITHEVALSEFINTFNRSLEDKKFKICSDDIAGVQVLDAMSARAIPFTVLFIMGMNEKVFPRNIREDPLLRDPVRKIMESVLGYKVEEKLNGFEEEKLLFYLLVNSATERLYITCQRTDDAGETRIPSWYISEVGPLEPVKEWRIPRRLSDKYSVSEFFDYYFLTPHELSARLIIEGLDAAPVMSKFCFDPVLYRRGKETISNHEKMTKRLTEFDGLTGFIEGYWYDVVKRGISPTSMEMFALCPFSYFSRHLLGLKTIERPETIVGIRPHEAGNICHTILKKFYSGLSRVIDRDINALLKDTAMSVFIEYEKCNPVGYAVVWDLERERLLTLLMDFVETDLNDLSLSGFSPYLFEKSVNGSLTSTSISDNSDCITVHGIIDRVDIHEDQKRFRIIDYKYKTGRKIPSVERDLSLAAIRGQKLQPPVYSLMVTEYLRSKEGIEDPVCDKVRFSYLAPNWTDVPVEDRFSEFPGDCWNSVAGGQILNTINLLLKGIRDGLYFIIPGNYCKSCDYSAMCRKNHFPSRSRAKKDDLIIRDYMNLRKVKKEQ